MAATMLDTDTALLLVDIQNGVVALDLAHPIDDVIGHARQLAEAFRAQGLPVVLINVVGFAPGRVEQRRMRGEQPSGWADIVPQLGPADSDYRVSKRTWGAFMHTDLEAYLRKQKVTQVVVAGISTSIGVESTARQAYELGFHVSLAVDAMTDVSPEAHINSVTRIFPRLGETATTQEILALLEKRGTRP